MLKSCFKPKSARLIPNYDLILPFFYFASLCGKQDFEKSLNICFVLFSRLTKTRLGLVELILKAMFKPSIFCFLMLKGWHEGILKTFEILSRDESCGVLCLNIISCLHDCTFIRCFQKFLAVRKSNINGEFPNQKAMCSISNDTFSIIFLVFFNCY